MVCFRKEESGENGILERLKGNELGLPRNIVSLFDFCEHEFNVKCLKPMPQK